MGWSSVRTTRLRYWPVDTRLTVTILGMAVTAEYFDKTTERFSRGFSFDLADKYLRVYDAAGEVIAERDNVASAGSVRGAEEGK